MPCGTISSPSIYGSLKLSIVAQNSFDFAKAAANIRLHPDESHKLHPNGDENYLGMSSSFHKNRMQMGERTIEARIQYLPSVKGLLKRKQTSI